ncbi:hypothetical protein QBC40DRAFT_273546 [Triangularia verruculosa]|uniref:Uncharacterized protein n=1 Tax=Triangularia verruculosa TaxID=2587418 RepID=A0AAN7AYE6_9PEZI|nr:hypothetical protein QBC40DRAFT_273546 [Triangularia verruculosa]
MAWHGMVLVSTTYVCSKSIRECQWTAGCISLALCAVVWDPILCMIVGVGAYGLELLCLETSPKVGVGVGWSLLNCGHDMT